MVLLLLLLLIVLPTAGWYWAQRYSPKHRWLVTGALFGAIASPLSMGLYSTYFIPIPYIGLVPGMVGLASSLFHGPPGFKLAQELGLLIPGHVVEGVQHVYVDLLNALVWAPVYGLAGWIIDRTRNKRSTEAAL
jgi:hypothetical protein